MPRAYLRLSVILHSCDREKRYYGLDSSHLHFWMWFALCLYFPFSPSSSRYCKQLFSPSILNEQKFLWVRLAVSTSKAKQKIQFPSRNGYLKYFIRRALGQSTLPQETHNLIINLRDLRMENRRIWGRRQAFSMLSITCI